MLTRDSTFTGTIAGVPVSGTIEHAFLQRDGRVRVRVRLPAPLLTVRGQVTVFTVILNADGTPVPVTAQQEPDKARRDRLADTKLTISTPGVADYDDAVVPATAFERGKAANAKLGLSGEGAFPES